MPTIICNGKEIELIHQCFPRPTTCPVCGSPTKINGAYTICTGDECSAKSIAKVNQWIKKVDIKYFGESRQQACFEAGIIKDPSDLYAVTEEQLSEVIGAGNAKHVMEQINKKRKLPLNVFVGSLGVKFLGRSNAKKLILAGIDSLERFMTFDPETEKNRIDGFGDNLFEIRSGIDKCKPLIDRLLAAGVEITENKPTQTTSESYSFCFTGVRLGSLKEKFESKGWVEKSSVSDKLNYLVAKDPTSNSSKMQKAREKGIKIISLSEFEEMLG